MDPHQAQAHPKLADSAPLDASWLTEQSPAVWRDLAKTFGPSPPSDEAGPAAAPPFKHPSQGLSAATHHLHLHPHPRLQLDGHGMVFTPIVHGSVADAWVAPADAGVLATEAPAPLVADGGAADPSRLVGLYRMFQMHPDYYMSLAPYYMALS